jgi:hypothetical protein
MEDVSIVLRALLDTPPSQRWEPVCRNELLYVLRANGMKGYEVELGDGFDGRGLTALMHLPPQPIERFHWFRKSPPSEKELDILYRAVGVPGDTHRVHVESALLALQSPLRPSLMQRWLWVASAEIRRGRYPLATLICSALVHRCGEPQVADALDGRIEPHALPGATCVQVAEAVAMLALVHALASASVRSLPIRHLQIALRLNRAVYPMVHHFRLILMVRHRKEHLETLLATVVWPFVGVDVLLRDQARATAIINVERRLVGEVFERTRFIERVDEAMQLRMTAPDVGSRGGGLQAKWRLLVDIVKAGRGGAALLVARAARQAAEEAGNEGPRVRVCALCGVEAPAMQRCGQCRAAYYCCRQHQRFDWAAHSGECQARR